MNKRPHILLLYCDQLRWDAIGPNNPHVKTPHLDRLAREGVNASHFFVQNTVCMPSRASMLTGLYPSTLGIEAQGIPLPQDTLTLHKMLTPYGYHTAQIGKLHFVPHFNRDHKSPHPDYGFDTCVVSEQPGSYDDPYLAWVRMQDPQAVDQVRLGPYSARHRFENTTGFADKNPLPEAKQDYQTFEPFAAKAELSHSAFVASETIRCISENKQKPFFITAGFFDPHPPLRPPQAFLDLYHADDLPLPEMTQDQRASSKYAHLSDKDWQEFKKYYYATISHLDDCIGKIISHLETEGLLDDTLILFTSDHGEHLGDHGLTAKGSPGFDSTSRVPFIARYPKAIAQNQTVHALAEAVDVVPTVLDFCGIQIPNTLQGKSMKPLLTGSTQTHRASVFCMHRKNKRRYSRMVRTHEFLYVAEQTDAPGLTEGLYLHESDPHQLDNRIADPEAQNYATDGRKLLLSRIMEAVPHGEIWDLHA